ncbi:glycosyltransferase family 4 protein [Candidatus Uhrbacteria bacterium]|nr:glycosyltransferase family 4 protein [Candidatus Uhrbacteria bacterium]
MRIAMIGQKGVPVRSGGVERHVHDLVRRLAGSLPCVFVYCRKRYCGPDFSRDFFGAQRIFIPTVKNKYLETLVHTFFSTCHALASRMDVYHFHGIGPALFSWLPRLLHPRAKVVLTFHCQDYFHQKWGFWGRCAFRLGEWIGCRMAHRIIVVSPILQKYVKERYGRYALTIPNTVPPTEIQPNDILEKMSLRPNEYLLSVSRLVRHKGIHTIIHAYASLHKESYTLPPLVIVGDGSFSAEYVRELKKLALGTPSILFVGEQSHDALAQLYSHARLFIHASETEGLSYALLEAMSYGCAVLVSDIAENAAVLPSIGVQFKTGDSGNLREKIIQCLSIQFDYSYRDIYREHVESHFNFEDAFQRSLALYESLAE